MLSQDLKALKAIFIKNWKSSLTAPWALLTIFFWPVLDVVTMGYVSVYANQLLFNITEVGGISYLQYMVSGAIFWAFLNVAILDVSQIWTREKWEDTLNFVFRLPVKRWVLILGNSLFGISRAFIATFNSLVFSWLMFGVFFSANILYLLPLLLLTVASVYGLSIIIATLGLSQRELEAFSMAIIWILSLFSGIYYPLSVLPAWMQSIGKLFPVYYAVEVLRGVTVYGKSVGELSQQIAALIFFSIVLTAFGLIIFNRVEKNARKSGAIGEH